MSAIHHAEHDYRYGRNTRHLCRLYDQWLVHTGWPAMSADELVFEIEHHRENAVGDRHAYLTRCIGWLNRFMDIWNRRTS
jgi:hypothetical protein